MPTHKRELPGDVLADLMREHDITSVKQFTAAHEVRVAKALEAKMESLSQEEVDRLFDRLAYRYDRWANRAAILWQPQSPPKWRALFTHDDLDALVFAGWFVEGSAMHERFVAASRLQDALRITGSYAEVEASFPCGEGVDTETVYSTLCWALASFLRDHARARSWSFDAVADLSRGLARNALPALADLGLVTLPDGWEDALPDLGPTRGQPGAEQGQPTALVQGVYEWAYAMLSDAASLGESGSNPPDGDDLTRGACGL